MRIRAFSSRNFKETLRDPMSLIFGIGFPVVIMTMMTVLSKNIEGMPDIFSINVIGPNMIVFGLSFLSIFTGLLVSTDRESAFLTRLMASPMTATDYIMGYLIPMLPVAALQSAISIIYAIILGMDFTWHVIVSFVVLMFVALLFSGFGLLFGTILGPKAIGGVNTVIINVAAWLSGTWFSLDVMSDGFQKVCKILPFYHCNKAMLEILDGNFGGSATELVWVSAYSVVIIGLAVICFKRKMEE